MRGGRGNQHTEMRVVAGASSHSSHRRVEPVNFGDVRGIVGGHGSGGWRDEGSIDHWPFRALKRRRCRAGVLVLFVSWHAYGVAVGLPFWLSGRRRGCLWRRLKRGKPSRTACSAKTL